MVIEIAWDGDIVVVDGVTYVREDVKVAEPTERWVLLNRLCREYGVERKDAAKAARSGELDARLPKGQTRGRRCRRSEFVRWLENDYMGEVEQ